MEPRGPESLDILDLGGLFVILLAGIILACVIACGECIYVWWEKKRKHEVIISLYRLSFISSYRLSMQPVTRGGMMIQEFRFK